MILYNCALWVTSQCTLRWKRGWTSFVCGMYTHSVVLPSVLQNPRLSASPSEKKIWWEMCLKLCTPQAAWREAGNMCTGWLRCLSLSAWSNRYKQEIVSSAVFLGFSCNTAVFCLGSRKESSVLLNSLSWNHTSHISVLRRFTFWNMFPGNKFKSLQSKHC